MAKYNNFMCGFVLFSGFSSATLWRSLWGRWWSSMSTTGFLGTLSLVKKTCCASKAMCRYMRVRSHGNTCAEVVRHCFFVYTSNMNNDIASVCIHPAWTDCLSVCSPVSLSLSFLYIYCIYTHINTHNNIIHISKLNQCLLVQHI